MQRNLIIGAVTVCILAGWVMVVKSPELGMRAAHSWLVSQGGSADTNLYMQIMDGTISAYRTLGAILVGGGVLGFFLNAGRLVGAHKGTD